MLSNTSGFTGNYICFTDIVKQRCLTVVNVSHYGYNRCTRLQIFRSIFILRYRFSYVRTYILSLEAKFISNQVDCFRIQTLIDRYHDTDTHTSTDNLIDRDVHHAGQLVCRNKLRQLQHFAFRHFLIFQLLLTVESCFTFLFTIFGCFILSFSRQTSQSFFYLLSYIFITYLNFR